MELAALTKIHYVFDTVGIAFYGSHFSNVFLELNLRTNNTGLFWFGLKRKNVRVMYHHWARIYMRVMAILT